MKRTGDPHLYVDSSDDRTPLGQAIFDPQSPAVIEKASSSFLLSDAGSNVSHLNYLCATHLTTWTAAIHRLDGLDALGRAYVTLIRSRAPQAHSRSSATRRWS